MLNAELRANFFWANLCEQRQQHNSAFLWNQEFQGKISAYDHSNLLGYFK